MSEFQKDRYRFSPVAPLVPLDDDIVEKRREQIINFTSELVLYSVVIKDLAYIEVPYNIRNELLNIALYIVGEVELYENFVEKKELPIVKIYKKVAKPRRYIEQYKEYIITYLIILGNPIYNFIHDYMKIIEEDKRTDKLSTPVISEDNNTRGIIITKNKKSAIVMNSSGEFKKVKIIEEKDIGEETEGIKGKMLKDYKLQVSILLFLVIFTLAFGIYKYNKPVSTVVVDASVPIKLDVNSLGKVVKVNISKGSNTKSISNDEILDRDIDSAIYKIIKFYNEKSTITSNTVVITISGKAIEYGVLENTQAYVKEKSIWIKINNSGMEQRLY